MNWSDAPNNDPIIADTENNIVHFTQPIELAVARRGSITSICGVDFTVKDSPLPAPLPVSAI